MTMEELISELRGHIEHAKREDGERWRSSEIIVYAEQLEDLLDEIEAAVMP